MTELLLPICTFRRVFDTVPVQEVVGLAQLVAALRRFQLRPDVLARSQKEIGRVRRSVSRAKAGLHASGRYAARLGKAAEAARAARRDPSSAVEALGLDLEVEARKSAKKDLRIWSPTLYRPERDKRGGDHVTHVSCLVLDFDDGTPMAEASDRFERWFHVVHSTWSHDPEHPRFRLVLPLASCVPSASWRAVWEWGHERAGGRPDPALKSPASHYALPAVPNPSWPRAAFSRPGELLDPVALGLVPERTVLALAPQGPSDGSPSVFRGEEPDKQYLDHEDADGVYFVDEHWDDDWEEPAAPGGSSRTDEESGTPGIERTAGRRGGEEDGEPGLAARDRREPEADSHGPPPAREARTSPRSPSLLASPLKSATGGSSRTDPKSGPADDPAPGIERTVGRRGGEEDEEQSLAALDIERIVALVARLEARFALHPTVVALERLAAMRDSGALTQKEFRAAKRALLEL